jgi:hypothetical protein
MIRFQPIRFQPNGGASRPLSPGHLRFWFHYVSPFQSLLQLGRWWDPKEEIDVVGLWRGEVTLVGECKWTVGPVDGRVLANLQRKAQQLPLTERPLWVLASRSGFDRSLRQRAEHENLLLLEPSDLHADDAREP